MNVPAEIAILKKEIRDLTKRVNQKSPFVTWGTIVGKLRDQADIAKNFRLKLDNNREVTAEDQAYIKLANGTQAMKNLSEIGGSGSSLEKEHDWASPYSYCGTAPSGSLTSASTWEIKRIEILSDGSTDIKSASLVKWDDRLTVIYS